MNYFVAKKVDIALIEVGIIYLYIFLIRNMDSSGRLHRSHKFHKSRSINHHKCTTGSYKRTRGYKREDFISKDRSN